MRTLALVPARAGSKGLPGKNTRSLGGRPLLSWSILAARACPLVDLVAVTSDGEDILSVAAAEGAEIIRRPAPLATDDALPKDAALHAIAALAERGEEPFERLVLLQPTSPLRTGADISDCLACLDEPNVVSAATACEAEPHPARVLTVGEDGEPRPYRAGDEAWRPRQSLTPAFALNGAVYAVDIRAFGAQDGPSFLFGKCRLSVMPRERSVDIDTALDFHLAERLLSDRAAAPGVEKDDGR